MCVLPLAVQVLQGRFCGGQPAEALELPASLSPQPDPAGGSSQVIQLWFLPTQTSAHELPASQRTCDYVDRRGSSGERGIHQDGWQDSWCAGASAVLFVVRWRNEGAIRVM